MKILVLIGSRRLGGGEILAADLAVKLHERGHRVAAGVPASSVFFEPLMARGIRVYNIPFVNRFDPLSILKLRRLASKGWDIVHSHLRIAAYLTGKTMGNHAGTKVVVHSHGLDRATDFSDSDIIITGSFAARSFLIMQGVEPRKVLVKMNPRPGKLLFSQDLKALNEPPHRNVVLCVSRLHKAKGHHDLLRAFKLLIDNPDIASENNGRTDCCAPENGQLKLYIIGDGPEHGRIRKLIKKLGITEHVKLIPETYDINRYYRTGKVLVLPSHRECLPLTILEALYHEVPVVAADIGGVKEVIHHEKTGLLVAPGDIDGLAREMSRVLFNRTLAEKLAANGRLLAENHSLERWVADIERVYNTIGAA